MRSRVLSLTALAAALPRVASACPVCFGAADGRMLQGSNMGIAALLVVTLAVLLAFAAFFASLARRSALVDAGGSVLEGEATSDLHPGGSR